MELAPHTACDNCSRHKKKCDRQNHCSTCVKNNKNCEYSRVDRRRRQSIEAAVEHSRGQIHPPRRLRPEQMENTGMEALRSPGPSRPLEWSTETIPEQPRIFELRLIDIGLETLPSEQTTINAVRIYSAHVEPVFHIASQDRCGKLIQKIYHESTTPSDADICELCAIAAAGCQYDSDLLLTSQSQMKQYFYHCYCRLPNIKDTEYLQALRAWAGLSLCTNLNRPTITASFISSGLHLARLKPCRLFSDDFEEIQIWTEWAAIVRTLKFLESWIYLYYHGCYQPPEDNEEILDILSSLDTRVGDADLASALAIHSELCKISILGAKVYTNIDFCHSSWKAIEDLGQALDTWRQELPTSLRLQFLVSENVGVSEDGKRLLLIPHLVYLQYRLLGYLLKLQHCTISERLRLPKSTLETCTGFTKQLSWVASFIHRDNRFNKCWLVIHAFFISSGMLLLSACQYLLSNIDIKTIWDILFSVQSNIDSLKTLGIHSVLASNFYDALLPLQRQVAYIAERSAALTHAGREFQMRIGTILNPEEGFKPAQIVPVIGLILQSMNLSPGYPPHP